MIRARIREIAEARGVPNAYQLGVLIGVTPNVSARLWKDDFAQIGKVTLDKLCSSLGCSVGDLLVYESPSKHSLSASRKSKPK
jgi:DNA-binding Xre family transcriptional regulator